MEKRLDIKGIIAGFKDPANIYLPQYFWFLNHELKTPVLKAQLSLMKEAGAGGAVLHARTGRITPYMGQPWLDCIADIIGHGHDIGMKIWLYDEDGFPSGYAGGKTVEPDVKNYSANFIVLLDEFELECGERLSVSIEFENESSEFYGAVAVEAKDNGYEYQLINYPKGVIDISSFYDRQGKKLEWIAPDTGFIWLVLIFAREWNPRAPNLLSKDAMHVFIKETHEKYAKHLKDRGMQHLFSNTILGIFTDEPGLMYCLGDKSWRRIVPYSREMDREYKQRFSITLLDGLPAVFYTLDNRDPSFRLNFWEVVGDLYQNAFFKSCRLWCEKNGIAFIGHVANEGNLYNQVRDQVDFFKGASQMHFGCCDQLGELFRPEFEKKYTLANCDNMVAPRLAASAARIYNLPRVSSECFGSAGWNLSLEKQKQLVDWQISNGVNLFIPHDFSYSIDGERKRDHPPAFNACSYFKKIKVLNDYIGRLSFIFSLKSKERVLCPRIGVIHGALTVLASMNPAMGNSAAHAHNALAYVVDILQRLHLDFDIIPEQYLSTLKFHDGYLTDNKNYYDLIIVLSLETLRSSTQEVLVKFCEGSSNDGSINQKTQAGDDDDDNDDDDAVADLKNSDVDEFKVGSILFIQKIPGRFYGKLLNKNIEDYFWNCLGIRPDTLKKSLDCRKKIDDLPRLVTVKTRKDGRIGFIQAPANPIYRNHLMKDVDDFCKLFKRSAISVHEGNVNVGDITARRLDLECKELVSIIFMANVSSNYHENTEIKVNALSVSGNKLWKEPIFVFMDPTSGNISEIPSSMINLDDDGHAILQWSFKPSESILFLITERYFWREEFSRPIEKVILENVKLKDLEAEVILNQWRVTPLKFNIINLNEWQVNYHVQHIEIERPSYLKYIISHVIEVQIDDVPSFLKIIVDGNLSRHVNTIKIKVNDSQPCKLKNGEVLDHFMLETTNIAKLFKPGLNTITVITSAGLASPILTLTEPLKLHGDFLASKDDDGHWKLSRWKIPLTVSSKEDLVNRGLPNYIFPLEFETALELDSMDQENFNYYILLPSTANNNSIYEVFINEENIGTTWFGDFSLILPELNSGLLQVKIRCFPYPTNLFQDEKIPLGLLEPVKIVKIPKIKQ
ncbi:MAG: hypothetical protein ACTSWN_08210 [Promethearchaeota archaeon]